MTTLVNATVKYPSKEIETRFGKRINVVLVSDSGEEIKQWSEPDNAELKTLKKNQKVTLMKNGDKYTLVSPNDNQQYANADPYSMFGKPQTTANEWLPWPDEYKKKLSQEAGQLIDLYAYCYKQVKQKMPELKEESVRSVSTGIFIQLLKGGK